jgi:hypothetical protein
MWSLPAGAVEGQTRRPQPRHRWLGLYPQAQERRYRSPSGAVARAWRPSDATSLGIQRYLTGLRETMKPISVHHHFRALKTFFNWCVEATPLPQRRGGASHANPSDPATRA